MGKKIFLLGVILIMSLGLLSGCKKQWKLLILMEWEIYLETQAKLYLEQIQTLLMKKRVGVTLLNIAFAKSWVHPIIIKLILHVLWPWSWKCNTLSLKRGLLISGFSKNAKN